MTHVQHEHPRATTESRAMNTADILALADPYLLTQNGYYMLSKKEMLTLGAELARSAAPAPFGESLSERWFKIVQEVSDHAKENAQALRKYPSMEAEARARELGAQYLIETAQCILQDEQHAAILRAKAAPAPAESADAFNRKLRAQLEQEWTEVQHLKRACQAAPTPQAASPEAITLEAVATIVVRNGELDLEWLGEGGLQDMGAGEVLMICASHKLTDDNGSGEVYLATPQPVPSSEAVAATTQAADVTDEQILKTYLDWTGGPDEKIDFARRVLALRPAPVAATGKADERDAARYRWLRNNTSNMHYEHHVGRVKYMDWHMNDRGDSPAILDAAIDALSTPDTTPPTPEAA